MYVMSSDHSVEPALGAVVFDCLDLVAGLSVTTCERHTIVRHTNYLSESVSIYVLS